MIELNNSVIIDSYWGGECGIVCTQDKFTRKYKFYISKVDGYDEENDSKHIADWGNKFPEDAGKALFNHIDFNKDWIAEHPEYFI